MEMPTDDKLCIRLTPGYREKLRKILSTTGLPTISEWCRRKIDKDFDEFVSGKRTTP